MKIAKIVACYVAFLFAFGLAVDACSTAHASDGPRMTCVDGAHGPLGASDVTFAYGSQIPGHVRTVYVFTAPMVIRAHVRHGALSHANHVARMAPTYRVSAAYHTTGDLPGAPQDVSGGACETIKRADGTSVRICGGSVRAFIRADGSEMLNPWTDAALYN